MRETAFRPADHASTAPSGAAILVSDAVMDNLIDKLHNGDPVKGWAGDPRLAVAFNRQTQRWELWRREANEQYSLVARSQPFKALPDDIIEELVRRDVRRGYDPREDVDRHNARRRKQEEDELFERMGPSYERLFWALRKDDRVGAGL